MKRSFDFVLAALSFVPCLFFVFSLSVLILTVDRFSPFYIQKRVGKNGKPFWCWKLQTMQPPSTEDEINDPKKDATRVTKLGAFLRDHGWDEIPQLWNVVKGEMSFVGPRPLLFKTLCRIREKNFETIEMVKEWEQARSQVRPGITGCHQVNQPGNISILKADMELLDSSSRRKRQILFITFLVFFLGKKVRL